MKNISAYTKKTIIFSIVTIYRSACKHPFVLGIVSLLLVIHSWLPHLFGILVSCSPIIICTALLLGVLLSYGQPNIPEIEEQKAAHISSPAQSHTIINDLIMEEDESFSTQNIYNRKNVEHGSKLETMTVSSILNEKKEKESGVSVISCLSAEMNKKQISIDDAEIHKKSVENLQHPGKAETYEAKPLLYADEVADDTFPESGIRKEVELVERQTPLMEGLLDPCVVSSWKITDDHDASESESDCAESSSPDASMADIIPMLDELHPLLDADDPLPLNASMDDLHSLSDEDDGMGEDAENQEEGGEEEEETKEEHEDGAALAVKWTEDDAKNLLVLGTSELERNQRLETLIAKRRARKNLSLEMNLIDLNAHETLPLADDFPRIQMQIPPVSTSKRNPFDLPYDLDPVPGSAPSVLLPRKNPFDLPLDVAEETGGPAGAIHQGSVAVQQRDVFFSRHESFALGASFLEFNQEKYNTERPYFVTERAVVEEPNCAHLERQVSDKSDSKVSSVHESESVSSTADQDYVDQLPNHLFHQQGEFGVPIPVDYGDHAERGSNSDDEVDSINPISRYSNDSIHSQHDIICSTVVLGVPVHDFIDKEQNRHELDLSSPTSEAAKSDMAEETCIMSSSSYSSGISTKTPSIKSEGSNDHQILSRDSANASSYLIQSVGLEVAITNDHGEEPVYDSSPSATETYPSNMPSPKEEFLHGEKGNLKSSSLPPSEAPVEPSGVSSVSVVSERSMISVSVSDDESIGKLPTYDNRELWVASSNLSPVDEIGSLSREIGVIREQDIAQVEFTELNDEYDHPIQSSLPESPSEQTLCRSSSTGSDSSEDTTIDMGMDLHFSKLENVVGAPHVDVSAMCTSSSQVLANTIEAESLTAQASFVTSILEQIKTPENGDASSSLPGDHVHASTFVATKDSRQVEGTELPNLSENIKIIEAERSKCSTDSKDEVLSNQENEDVVTDPVIPFRAHARIEEIKRIDDEALLLELDVIGDFHTEEMKSDNELGAIYHLETGEGKITEADARTPENLHIQVSRDS